jgi:Spy/CpxP family protein refolding chaperone
MLAAAPAMGYPIEAPQMRLNKVYFDIDQKMALNGSITRETREKFRKVRTDQMKCVL